MISPPIMLIARMIIAAITSPRTNFEAPSMAPKKSASRRSISRRRSAACGVSTPALISASIAICRPGRLSSMKRAETSATREAPLVTTTKLMMMRMTKMMPPTT